jgi:AraC family L-rhamnose operon regulatory protein RhaS
MLTETGLTIAEIAYTCGFKNQFHFSRKVTECQGMSPREFRRKAWGK